MCGIVGVSSVFGLSAQEKEAFRTLLYLDVLRGDHSTGVAMVKDWTDNTEVTVVKEVGGASELFYYKGVGTKKKDLTFSPVTTMIGHNRFATQGEINEANAHPFEFEHIVGVHNGTLPKDQVKKLEGGEDFDVDSQALYNHINQHGLADLWSKTDGAMALAFFDKRDGSLHLARNSQRPLFFAYNKAGTTLFWASEGWMIQIATTRSNIQIGEVESLAVDKHFTVKKQGNAFEIGEEALVPYERPTFFRQGQSVGTGYYRGYGWGSNSSDLGDEWGDYVSAQKAKESPSKVVDLHPPKGQTTNLVIKEIHGNTDRVIGAVGRLPTGEEVRVNFSLVSQTKLAEQIHNQAYGNGYFVTSKLNRAVFSSGNPPYWVHYEDLQYVKLKEPFKIKYESDGKFTIPTSVGPIPYVSGKVLPNRAAWEGAVEYGCDCCGTVPTWEQRDDIQWIYELCFLCKTCKESDLFKIA